jgi:hypothetical protein
MGMDCPLKVVFCPPSNGEERLYESSFKVVSKFAVYTIPIEASIGTKAKEI